MHRCLSLTLLSLWLLSALLGIRLAGFVHLLPVVAGVFELMHLLIGGGPLARSPLPTDAFVSAPTTSTSLRRLGSTGEAQGPATSAESTHVQIE